MRIFSLIGILVLVFGAAASTQSRQKPDLDRRIESVIGTDPFDCGTLRVTSTADEVAKGIECVKSAAGRRQASKLIKPMQGIDSYVAYGLVSKKDGSFMVFTYDSDPSGGGGSPSRFITKPCVSPAAVPGFNVRANDFVVVCGK